MIPMKDELTVAMATAKVKDRKMYVTADGLIEEGRPAFSDMFYECYPGGRVVAWGLRERPEGIDSVLHDSGLTEKEIDYLGGSE